MTTSPNTPALREAFAGQLLGRTADSIDITPSQRERATQAYGAISEVIASGSAQELRAAKVFPQGSFAIGTVIRPVADEDGEFDVDLACLLAATTALAPARAKKIVGDQLASDGRYASKLEEKSRCWRVHYAGEFHLDVCPLVSAGASNAIPDKELARWIPTHPEAYATWFNQLADRARTAALTERAMMKADIAPLPDSDSDKGWLRRVVQLLKRHRDMWSQRPGQSGEFAPISVILTTLAANATKRALASGIQFESPYQLMHWIIADMPRDIEQRHDGNRAIWWVGSPVAVENFANRWNGDQRWVETFYAWHAAALADVARVVTATGLDDARTVLEESFGSRAAKAAIKTYAESMRGSRDAGSLRLAATAGGLIVSSGGTSPVVPRHTFFGG